MSLGEDDLSAYFRHISYAGGREPNLAALAGIVAAHAGAIPFENLDVLLRQPIRLDAAALVDKLVHRRRGGYCFEHNTLLREVLTALGFAVEGLSARVVWMRGPDDIPPRSHMLLRVALPDGNYLADVGFGGLTLTAPLRFAPGVEQTTPHEPHRLVERESGELELQARLDGDWVALYRFEPRLVQQPIDYEPANWFTSTHPDSIFVGNLMCARPDAECRYALLNSRFTVRRPGRPPQHRALRDAGELAEVLAKHFRSPVSRDECDRVWQAIGPRIVAAPG